MELCERGKLLAKQVRDVMVSRDGEPTALYYHVEDCHKCEELRAAAIEKSLAMIQVKA